MRRFLSLLISAVTLAVASAAIAQQAVFAT